MSTTDKLPMRIRRATMRSTDASCLPLVVALLCCLAAACTLPLRTAAQGVSTQGVETRVGPGDGAGETSVPDAADTRATINAAAAAAAAATSSGVASDDDEWEPTDPPTVTPKSAAPRNPTEASARDAAATASPSDSSAAADRESLPSRITFNRSGLRSRGLRSKTNPRRFKRAAHVHAQSGREITPDQALSVSHTRVLYDVELRSDVIALDDITAVLRCDNAPPSPDSPESSLFDIRLTMLNSADALSLFPISHVLHGDTAWGCRSNGGGNGNDTSAALLGRIHSVRADGAHYAWLQLSPANLTDVFAQATVNIEEVTAHAMTAGTADSAAADASLSAEAALEPPPTPSEIQLAADLRVPIAFIRAHPQLFNADLSAPEAVSTPAAAIPQQPGHDHALSAAARDAHTDGPASPSPAHSNDAVISSSHRYRSLASVGSLTGVTSGGIYFPGSSVALKWSPSGFLSSDTVVVTLYKDVLFSDPWYLSRTNAATAGSMGFQFPQAGTPSSSSDSFYFALGWNCPVGADASSCGNYVESVRFSLPPVGVTITSPSAFSVYGPTDAVPVTYAPGTLSSSVTITFRLRQWGLISDSTIAPYAGSDYNFLRCAQSSCSFNFGLQYFPAALPSIQPYYIEATHSCTAGYFCTTSRSPFFMIPSGGSGRWNTNDGITASAPLPLASKSCTSLQCDSHPSLSGVDAIICNDLCSQGRSVSMSLQADNSFLSYNTQVSKFNLAYDWSGLQSAAISANIAVHGALSVTAAIDFDATLQTNVALLPRTSIPGLGLSASLGPVHLDIGFFVQVDAAFVFSVSGSGTLSLSHSLNTAGSVSLTYDTSVGWSVAKSLTPTSAAQPSVQIDVQAVSSVELSLRPSVGVQIAALGAEASIAADLWMRADAAFQYPAFPALSGYYQSPTTSNVALVHAGSCTTPHLLRYSVTAGVRNIVAAASINWNLGNALGLGALSSYAVSRTYSNQLVAAPAPYSLVTGCLLHAAQSDTLTVTITLTMDLSSLSSTDLHTFAFNLLADLAAALNVSPSRFVYLDTAMVTLSRREALHTMSRPAPAAHSSVRRRLLSAGSVVRFDVLPSDDDSSQPTPSQLQQLIASQTADSNSLLRRGVVTRTLVSPGGPPPSDSSTGSPGPPPPPGPPAAASGGSGSSLSPLVLIASICGAVLVIAAVAVACVIRRRKHRAQVQPMPVARTIMVGAANGKWVATAAGGATHTHGDVEMAQSRQT